MNYKKIAKNVAITAVTSLSLVAFGTIAQPSHSTEVQTVQAAGRSIAPSWRGRYMSNWVKMTITAHKVKIHTDVAKVGSYKKVKNGWYRMNFTNYRAAYFKYNKSAQIMSFRYTPRGATYYFFKQA